MSIKNIVKWLKVRVINHWQTSVVAVLLYLGFRWFHTGKIDFTDFKEYLVLVPTIMLLLMKNFKKDAPKQIS